MYRGFNLKLTSFEDMNYFKKGIILYDNIMNNVGTTLKKYTNNDGSLNGSEIQNDWFPTISSDVFISHSHANKDLAITLAGWLNNTFGINAFIDSCVWGYAEELLRTIDEKYCKLGNGNYSYEQRNYSTSHIHNMLLMALLNVMDKSECLFFINTPESIKASDVVNKTKSPWLYSEIAMLKLIHKETPSRRKEQDIRTFSKGLIFNEALKIEYEINLGHLTDINKSTLLQWSEKFSILDPNALDILYDMKPIRNTALNG